MTKIESQPINVQPELLSLAQKLSSLRQFTDLARGIFAAGIVLIYSIRKTYGAGAKQVAQESWDHPDQVDAKDNGDGTVTYTPKFGQEPVITITHSDGTTQKHRLRDPARAGQNPPEASKIIIAYDKEGRPTSIYIL